MLLRAVALLAIVLACIAYPAPVRAAAASPTSGTLSPANPSLSYTGGPYFIPNPTPQVQAVCVPATLTCDEFALTVQADTAFAAANNVQIKVQWPDPTADYDLYVVDANGNVVTSSPTGADPEVAVMPTVPGSYRVQLVTFLPLGQVFTATISFVPRAPAPPGTLALNYHNYPAPADMATSAGEPSIGVNWKTDHAMFQAGTRTYRVTFDGSTPLPGATWVEKSARIPNCDVQTGLDPIGFVDHATGRTFSSELLANPVVNSATCYSDNEGETWSPSEGGGVRQGIDHQTIGGGPFKPGLGAGPTTSYPNAVYYCSQMVVSAQCSRSDDGGILFHPAVDIYGGQCSGLHGHVVVAPSGTVYVPNRNCGGHAAAVVSIDNGATWSVRTIPGSSAHKSDPSIGISTGNVIYLGYTSADHHAHIAVSRDEGATWLNDTDVTALAGLENAVFPEVVAGDDSRAAYAFLGSPTIGDPEASNFAGVWQVYVAHTYDGGRTWTIATVDTPNDPVQRGCIWLSGGDNPCRNLLDFNGIDIDSHGVVEVGFADGCTDACVTTELPNDSTAGYRVEHGTIARQIAGKTLLSRFDPPQSDLAIADITATAPRAHQVVLTATVANIGNAAAAGVTVRFFDGSVVLGDAGPVAVAAGASAQLTYTWTDPAKGDHSITATADPGNTITEKDESNNSAKRLITIKGNKVQNGSFEQSSNGTTADRWTGTAGTGRDNSGLNAVDGRAAASGTAAFGNKLFGEAIELFSENIGVDPGEVLDLALSVKTVDASSAPSVQVQYLTAAGAVTSTVTALASSLSGTNPATQLTGRITVPAGITQLRLVLVAYGPTDMNRTGSVYFDDVWLWSR